MACDALRPSGSRKAEMPFETASSPVREEPPLAKDRSTAKREAPYSLPSPGAPSGTTPGAGGRTVRPGACLAGIRSSAQVQAIVALQQDEEPAEHAGTVAAGPAVQAAGVRRAVTWRGDKGVTQAPRQADQD